MVRSRGRMLDWSLHQWAQRPIGPLTRVRIGGAQPVRRLVGPLSRSTIRGSGGHGLNEQGLSPPMLLLTPNPNRSRGDVLKWWDVPPSPPQDLFTTVAPTPAVAARVQTSPTNQWWLHYEEGRGMCLTERQNPTDLLLDDPWKGFLRNLEGGLIGLHE
jgi:hypothetical protein